MLPGGGRAPCYFLYGKNAACFRCYWRACLEAVTRMCVVCLEGSNLEFVQVI